MKKSEYTQITVYRPDGKILKAVDITAGSFYRKELMKEDAITLVYSYNDPIPIVKGCYILTDWGRFEIMDTPRPKRNYTTGGFDYNIVFEAQYLRWRNRVFYHDRQGKFENAWFITDKPENVMSIVMSNLSALASDYPSDPAWTYSFFSHNGKTDIDTDGLRFLEFNGTSIFEALSLIAGAWQVEWWVGGSTIYIGKCEIEATGGVVVFDETVISEISSSPSSEDYASRLIAFGSTRNLPPDYRRDEGNGMIEKRLNLSAGTPYVDAWSPMSPNDVVEKVVVFKDIFPRQNLTVTEVTTFPRPIEDSNETFDAYRVKWSGMTFKQEYILPGLELRMVFQAGEGSHNTILNGMDFAAMFNPDGLDESDAGGQVIEIVRSDSYGSPIPNDVMKPAVGDKFVLYGFDAQKGMASLITDAENELLERATEWLKQISIDPSVYTCTTNKVRCAGWKEDAGGKLVYNAADEIDLNIGASVNIVSSLYFPSAGSRKSRIYAFQKQLDNKFQSTYQVGDSVMYSRLMNAEKNINEIKYLESTKYNKNAVNVENPKSEDKYNSAFFSNTPFLDITAMLNLKKDEATNVHVYCQMLDQPSIKIGGTSSHRFRMGVLDGFTADKVIYANCGVITGGGGTGYFTFQIANEGRYWYIHAHNTSGSKRSIQGRLAFLAFIKGEGQVEKGYTLLVTGEDGINGVSGGGLYKSGTSVAVSCEIDGDYTLNGWYDDEGVKVSSAQSFSYTMPAKNRTLTARANYTPKSYALTLNKKQGVASVTGAGSYPSGTEIDISCTLASKHLFEAWFWNGQRTEFAQTFHYITTAEAVTFEARALPFVGEGTDGSELLTVDADIKPNTTNTKSIGDASRRYKGIYAGTDGINTSGNITPSSNNAIPIGNSSSRFKNGYFGDLLDVLKNAVIGGDLSVNGDILKPLATASKKGAIRITNILYISLFNYRVRILYECGFFRFIFVAEITNKHKKEQWNTRLKLNTKRERLSGVLTVYVWRGINYVKDWKTCTTFRAFGGIEMNLQHLCARCLKKKIKDAG
ncbi:hypothetical protein Barb6XT_01844 [Bacteroidales bacterium Barb6XT]|nr:hypothetical protein Barb6XT_01844 [Bacteroidales bacterium Barb6XT]